MNLRSKINKIKFLAENNVRIKTKNISAAADFNWQIKGSLALVSRSSGRLRRLHTPVDPT